jgi:hypothetical protein
MSIVLVIAALVGTGAALVTVLFAAMTVKRMDTTIGLMAEQRAAQDVAHKQQIGELQAMLTQAHASHEDEMAERKHALSEELRLARLTQIGRVNETLAEISRILLEEEHLRPDGKLGHINIPTRLYAAKQRLRADVASVLLMGGPHLARSTHVASGPEFVFVDDLRSAIYSAAEEVAAVLDGEVTFESRPGGRLAGG